MKKVCFITESIYSLGGIQRVVTNISNVLIDNYYVEIICLYEVNKNKKIEYNLNPRVRVAEIYNSRLKNLILIPFKVVRTILRKMNFKNNFFDNVNYVNKNKLKKYLIENNFDFIISTGLNNCIILSEISHDINSKQYGWWHSSFENYVQSNTYNKNKIKKSLKNLETIVLTKNDQKLIKEHFGVDTKVVYNPIEINQKFVYNSNSNVFLAVGRYASVKRFDLLIEIFNDYCKVNENDILYIVGDGPEKKKLQKKIDNLNLKNRIFLIPQTDNIDYYYNKSAVMVMTSKSEGFPTVILEAMNHGLPIIGYYMPVFDEMVNEKNSMIIKNDNNEEFVNAMLSLSMNVDKRLLMSKESFKCIKKFDMNEIIKSWYDILN